MANDYTLDGRSLRALGFIPGHAPGSNIALAGAWDMPARLGTCYYEWLNKDAVEAYVDAGDIVFGGRTITLTGNMVGDTALQLAKRADTLREWLQTIPGTAVLAGKWGEWTVQLRKEIKIPHRGQRIVPVSMTFYEPRPVTTGLPPRSWVFTTGASGGMRDEATMWEATNISLTDVWSWQSFGVVITGITGANDVTERRKIDVTQSVRKDRYVHGGAVARVLTLTGWLIAADMADFGSKVRSLYWLFGSAGLRKLLVRGQMIPCFATDGIKVTDIQIRDQVFAQISVKLREGYV